MLSVSTRFPTFLFAALFVFSLAFSACTSTSISGGPEDGDAASDGDSTEDGDSPADGDTILDGDSVSDGDVTSDGDTVPDGDTVADGDADPDGDAVSDGDTVADGDTDVDGDTDMDGDGEELDLGYTVDPGAINFGDVQAGCCSDWVEVTITNTGTEPLGVTRVVLTLEEGIHADGLAVQLEGVDTGYLDVGQSETFSVRLCPENPPRDLSVALKVFTTQNYSRLIHLTAHIVSGAVEDVFHQPDYPKVDALFVVDCSGSMVEEQQLLAQGVDHWVRNVLAGEVDLHIGVTTMDMDPDGAGGTLVGEPAVLVNKGPYALSVDEIADKFSDRSVATGSCSGYEKGLASTHALLSSPEQINGFLRNDAKLVIVWLSDEDDQSEGDTSIYIDYIKSIKGVQNVNMIEAYALVGNEPDGCFTDSTFGDAGTRYIAAADALNWRNNSFYSICSTSYLPFFENLVDSVFALGRQFFLSELAVEESIIVTVDGEATTEFSYDAVSNSIVFAENHAPEPGSEIRVSYLKQCPAE